MIVKENIVPRLGRLYKLIFSYSQFKHLTSLLLIVRLTPNGFFLFFNLDIDDLFSIYPEY